MAASSIHFVIEYGPVRGDMATLVGTTQGGNGDYVRGVMARSQA